MKIHWKRHFAQFVVLLIAVSGLMTVPAAPVAAETVTVGMRTNPAALDPHFSKEGGTQMISMQFYETLLSPDENGELKPCLAESFSMVDDLTTEFKLRKNVKFHDGSEFTAEDVKFSIERVRDLKTAVASFASSVRPIKEITVVDPHTIRLKTEKADPLTVSETSRIYIVSHKAAANATTEDFNSGKAAIGTGPYQLVKYLPGEQIVLKRFEPYWGPKPYFEDAVIKNISNDAARVAALLSGSVDLIDQVPYSDLALLKKNEKISLWPVASPRLIYLHMDHQRDASPFITDKNGKPLGENPLKDKRVRVALSKLIFREALIAHTLYEMGEPAGQMVPKGLFGWSPELKPMAYDPKGALALLKEAGWGDGFGITIHGPNNRYPYDAQVLQTVAQFLAKGNIKVKVETMPKNVYFERATKQDFSLFLVGYGSMSGDAMPGLNLVLATYDKETKMGNNNRGRYSNPEYDAVMMKALTEMDAAKREKMLQEAAKIAFEDVGIIPLYFQSSAWATRKGFSYTPRRDERTLVINIKGSK